MSLPSFCRDGSRNSVGEMSPQKRTISAKIQTNSSPLQFNNISNDVPPANNTTSLYYEPYLHRGIGQQTQNSMLYENHRNNQSFLAKSKLNDSLILSNYENTNCAQASHAMPDSNLKEKYRFGQPPNQSMTENPNFNFNNSLNITSQNLMNQTHEFNQNEGSFLFETSKQQFLHNDPSNFWITVYGFESDMKDLILQDFSKIGPLENVVQGEGNWVHLKYTNHLNANQALGRNGRIYSNSYMIGVKKCLNKDIYGASNHNQSANLSLINTLQMPSEFATRNFQTKPNVKHPIRAKKASQRYRYSEQHKNIVERIFSYIFG